MKQRCSKTGVRLLESFGTLVLGGSLYLAVGGAAPPQATPQVQSVDFEEMVSPLDVNPNPGGGLRIFPDKDWPDETSDRTKVKVRATLSSPVLGYEVYFKVFDVDDPSSDDPDIDPTGPGGIDNRGTPRLVPQNPVKTDANGVAEVTLSVTMRPGDNFVVAASRDKAYLDGVHEEPGGLVDAVGLRLPTSKADATPMLTVWRRLHIEVDSMGLVTGNLVEGTVKAVNWVPGQTHVILDKPLDPGRFKPGRIIIDGKSFPVIGNNSVRVIVAGDARGLAGKAYKLYDDDDFNINDGAALLHGDEGEDVEMPDLSLIRNSDDLTKNVFAVAYVVPTYDTESSDDDVAFLLNEVSYAASDLKAAYKFDRRDWEAKKDFWTIYLFGAYQPTVNEDFDPKRDKTLGTLGVVDELVGEGATIFLETIAELSPNVNAARALRAETAVHEICHLFNAKHGEGEVMDGKSVNLGPKTINWVRTTPHP